MIDFMNLTRGRPLQFSLICTPFFLLYEICFAPFSSTPLRLSPLVVSVNSYGIKMYPQVMPGVMLWWFTKVRTPIVLLFTWDFSKRLVGLSTRPWLVSSAFESLQSLWVHDPPGSIYTSITPSSSVICSIRFNFNLFLGLSTEMMKGCWGLLPLLPLLKRVS